MDISSYHQQDSKESGKTDSNIFNRNQNIVDTKNYEPKEDLSNSINSLSLNDKNNYVSKLDDMNSSTDQGDKAKKFFIDTSAFTSVDAYSIDSGKSNGIPFSAQSSTTRSSYFVDSLSNYTSPDNISSLNSISLDSGFITNNFQQKSSKYFLDISNSTDNYSTDGFTPPVSHASSPTYVNNINSFSFTQTQVTQTQSPTLVSNTNLNFMTNPSNQNKQYVNSNSSSTVLSGDLLQMQLGNNLNSIQSTSPNQKPDPPKPPAIVTSLVYQVQFKRNFRYYVVLPGYNKEIKLNDYVKVYADRGEDLGLVVGCIHPQTFYSLKKQHSSNNSNKDDESKWELKYIFRLASTYEKSLLSALKKEEEEVLQNANKLVTIYSLPLVIVDVEYQFDKNKITILYEANKRVDFREFVRDLFAIYKTRIWMQQVPYGTKKSISNQVSPMQSTASPNYLNPSIMLNRSSDNAAMSQANSVSSQTLHSNVQRYNDNNSSFGNYSSGFSPVVQNINTQRNNMNYNTSNQNYFSANQMINNVSPSTASQIMQSSPNLSNHIQSSNNSIRYNVLSNNITNFIRSNSGKNSTTSTASTTPSSYMSNNNSNVTSNNSSMYDMNHKSGHGWM